MHIPVYVSTSEELGGIRCIKASRDITKDELIEAAPVIVFPESEGDNMNGTILGKYIYDWGEDTNACIVGYCVLTNHSYAPNVVYKRNFEKNKMEYYALRDIKKDEELYINYNGDPHDTSPLEEHYLDLKH